MISNSRGKAKPKTVLLLKSANFSIDLFDDIHWDLIGLDQNDLDLLKALKSRILWPPSKGIHKLDLKIEPWLEIMTKEVGQAYHVEDFLRKKKIWNSVSLVHYTAIMRID